ncbi:MAG: hypothetical protein GY794_08875 [bacterium]|nr:hypothetical protein [bacterium]
MTTYYCDLAEDFSNPASVGDTSGNPANGPGGFQSMIEGWGNHDALAAGDTLLLRGTGNLAKFIKFVVTDDKSGVWSLGDPIWNNNEAGGTPGDDWKGVLVYIDATTVYVQLNVASTTLASVNIADGLWNDTPATSILAANVTSVEAPGMLIDGASGTYALPISFVGVNSSWTEDGTLAILDANDEATSNVTIVDLNSQHFRNLHGKDSTGDGWTATATAYYSHYENCVVSGSGGDGFGQYPNRYSTYHRCKAYDIAGAYGFMVYFGVCFHCVAYNCATGFWVSSASLAGCVAYDCSSTGLNMNTGGAAYNCVVDNNATGITTVRGAELITGCRITNNAVGVYGSDSFYDPYCFYGGNTDNWSADLGIDLVDGVSTRTISDEVADIGYIDPDNATLADRNYALTNLAAARRQAVTL